VLRSWSVGTKFGRVSERICWEGDFARVGGVGWEAGGFGPVGLGGSSRWTDAKIVLRICDRDLEVEPNATGEGAGLLLPGVVLERSIRGRELIDEEVGWEWEWIVRGGAGGIGPNDGPGNLGGNATISVKINYS